MDNPFKPKEVKLFNYNKTNLEKKKLENITNNMRNVANTHYKKETNSYSDNIKRPDSYSDHIKPKPSYGDAFKRGNN